MNRSLAHLPATSAAAVFRRRSRTERHRAHLRVGDQVVSYHDGYWTPVDGEVLSVADDGSVFTGRDGDVRLAPLPADRLYHQRRCRRCRRALAAAVVAHDARVAGARARVPGPVLALFDAVAAQCLEHGHGDPVHLPPLPGLVQDAGDLLRARATRPESDALVAVTGLDRVDLVRLVDAGVRLVNNCLDPGVQRLRAALQAVPDLRASADLYPCTDGSWALSATDAVLRRSPTGAEALVLQDLLTTCSLVEHWPSSQRGESPRGPRPGPEGSCTSTWTVWMWTGLDETGKTCTTCPGHWDDDLDPAALCTPWS